MSDNRSTADPTPPQEQPQQPPVELPVPPTEPTEPTSPPQEPEQQPQQQEPVAAPRSDWRDRRIGELTQRSKELRDENARLRAQIGSDPAAARGPDGRFQQPAGYNGPPSQEAIDAEINNRAMNIAANQDFNRRCNEVAEVGRRNYADFDSKVQSLVGLVDANDPQSVFTYNEFLQAAIETGEASRLIHILGGDLDEASRILSMTPRRMTVELTRMAAKPVQELSRTPRPINPAPTNGMGQRTSASPDDPGSDSMSTEEWMRRRNEQIAARTVRR
jgi:hypothetical protein